MPKLVKLIIAAAALTFVFKISISAQQKEVVSGEVLDNTGAAIAGAVVTLKSLSGKEKTTSTDKNGSFRFTELSPENYSLKVEMTDFAEYEIESINPVEAKNQKLKIVLSIKTINENVDVSETGDSTPDPTRNSSAVILKEEDLNALPDNPDDLEAALRALAGTAVGPEGGQIYIDGFIGGVLPSKESIQEVRINFNPFAAEYNRLGFDRIEIITKPGSTKWRGLAFFNFNDAALNARNPFSTNKADSREKYYGGFISGPVIKNKATFILRVNNRDDSLGSLIRANIIDENYNIAPFFREYTIFNKVFFANPQLDYQLNKNNSLSVRYIFQRSKANNIGGGFSLPSQAIDLTNDDHNIQISETAILNAKTVNETRFQYRYTDQEQAGDNGLPRVIVQGAFIDGGTPFGLNFNHTNFWEFQNYTTTSVGKNLSHSIKFGLQILGRNIKERADSNFNGAFTFAGFVSPTQNNPYDLDNNGIISSIEQYRAKILGENNPLYNPTQFILTEGNPLAGVSGYNIGLFVQDNWRLHPKFSLLLGLRYENQNNIRDNMNFAPRIGFAYSPGAGGKNVPKTTFLGGFGIFYTRVGENLFLDTERFDGIRQRRFIVTRDNAILSQPVFGLNGVTNVPTVNQLAGSVPLSNTPWLISPDIQAPYFMQGAVSVERKLFKQTSLSAYYVFSRNLHLIRSRNINAPVCPFGFTCPVNDQSQLQTLRPDPSQGNIYQYESSGVYTDHRLIIGFRSLIGRNYSIIANYFLGKSKGNVEGFPAYSYDLSTENGNTLIDIRHSFTVVNTIRLPYKISLSSFIVGRSGLPFDITTGTDLNGDSIFNDRPTFAQLSTACAQYGLTDSWCSVAQRNPNAIIPKNFGRGPGRFTTSLSIDKSFSFGKNESGSRTTPQGAGRSQKPYNLSIGVNAANLLNTNNKNNPVGNISSPLFGQSTNSVGNFGQDGQGSRTIRFRAVFSWN